MAALSQEQLRTVLLDTKNRVQTITIVYVGSVNTAMIRVGEIFKAALAWNSAALIVVHNHPSGEATPNPQDVMNAVDQLDLRRPHLARAAGLEPTTYGLEDRCSIH